MSNDTASFPRSWFFHNDDGECDGPTFEGRFTGIIEQAPTSYGDKPVARFIEEATGEEVSIWLMNQALLDQLSKLAPEKDELVKIDYHGKKVSKTSGRKYQSFKASCPERPVVQLSWAALGVSDEEEEMEE